MTYATEFPDMANDTACATMASRADAWEDTSWGCDQSPSFTCDVFVVWCQPERPEDREFPEMKRFAMVCEGESMLETDDFADILAFIDDGKRFF